MEKIKKEIEPIINEMGYDLVSVNIESNEGSKSLVVTINSDKGINVDDCAKVSRAIDSIIEENESVKGSFSLVVSSPGTG